MKTWIKLSVAIYLAATGCASNAKPVAPAAAPVVVQAAPEAPQQAQRFTWTHVGRQRVTAMVGQ